MPVLTRIPLGVGVAIGAQAAIILLNRVADGALAYGREALDTGDPRQTIGTGGARSARSQTTVHGDVGGIQLARFDIVHHIALIVHRYTGHRHNADAKEAQRDSDQ